MRPAPLVALLCCACVSACVDLTPPPFLDGDGGVGDVAPDQAPGDASDARDARDAPLDMTGDALVDRATDAPVDAGEDGVDGGRDTVPDSGVDAPPPPRLVGYWRLDTYASSMTADSSGLNHTGMVAGTPGILASSGLPVIPGGGNIGALDFGRSDDDAVRVADSADLRPAKLTIALWVRFNQTTANFICGSNPSNYQYIVYKRNSRGGNTPLEGYALVRQGDNTLGFVLSSGSGVRDVVSTAMSVPTGIWMHVAASYDGDMMRIYLNGVLQAGSPRPHTGPLDYDPTGGLYLARSGECGQAGSVTTSDGFLNGALDDVRIYDDFLSGSAIMDLAAGRL